MAPGCFLAHFDDTLQRTQNGISLQSFGFCTGLTCRAGAIDAFFEISDLLG